MLDSAEIALRLGVATAAGGLMGLNRDLRGKPIGLRTLGLVGLATSLAVILVQADSKGLAEITDATSRVIQGILTGIGFLGAGVIVHRDGHHRVHGLTSAACTWLTACMGIVCGAGEWRLALPALAIAFLVLIFGGRVEHAVHRLLGGSSNSPPPGAADLPPPGDVRM